ncbi:MAG: hypothetical protein JRJ09_18810 [Deltaproteobacteria bacterium]|nr:hypothetical protein [Deltaproteobacteria bacterium]
MKNKIPVVKCFRSGETTVKFWCPFCEEWHVHGFTEDVTVRGKSHRLAHCRVAESPFKVRGYYLRLMSKREINEIAQGSMKL